MPIKLIATDLDGTLMAPDHMTVTRRTKDALEEAHSRGIKIAIATGRPLSLTDYVTQQIPFADYVIYANGAGAFDRNANKIIYENLVSNTEAKKIVNYFLTEKVFFEIYINGKSHYQQGTEELFDSKGIDENFIEEVKKTMTPHSNLVDYLGDKGIEKITLYSIKEKDFPRYEEWLKSFGYETASSFYGNLEATAHGVNKGSALTGIMDELNITPDEVMCFGDAGNDIDMLKLVKYSFAMGNADEDCKKAAKFLAGSNAEDGLAAAVEEYVLNNG